MMNWEEIANLICVYGHRYDQHYFTYPHQGCMECKGVKGELACKSVAAGFVLQRPNLETATREELVNYLQTLWEIG